MKAFLRDFAKRIGAKSRRENLVNFGIHSECLGGGATLEMKRHEGGLKSAMYEIAD